MGERSYGGRTASERATERRARLVRATATVLAERGTTRTTMTAVCAEAGLTERYFYESFRNLDEALVATLDDIADRILGLVTAEVARTPGTAGERVQAAARALVELVVAEPAAVRVAVVHAAGASALRERRDALVGGFAQAIAAEAAALYGQQAWPTARALARARVLVAGLADLVGAWTEGHSDLDAEDLVEVAADLFEQVLRRPRG
ncbi:TetR/AcrR family transcriptional regulator [Nocardioides nanhaiensis]|uniref:Transcriptional regulator n=1 Tax=Nocardioides nanhaiensis TaxID=1476871 RepID=A0ABP8W072_9ACTN